MRRDTLQMQNVNQKRWKMSWAKCFCDMDCFLLCTLFINAFEIRRYFYLYRRLFDELCSWSQFFFSIIHLKFLPIKDSNIPHLTIGSAESIWNFEIIFRRSVSHDKALQMYLFNCYVCNCCNKASLGSAFW